MSGDSINTDDDMQNLLISNIKKLLSPDAPCQTLSAGESKQLQPFDKNYKILDLCIESIKGQFSKILAKHENDFIQAYKSYMDKVQKELLYWQKKLQDTVGKVLNDDTIASL
jgi:hypothetical protein